MFARGYISCTMLTKVDEKSLKNIGFKEITQQLELLEKASDLKFDLPDEILSSLAEMSLVRNLGLHNRWEVDSHYKDKTRPGSTGWEIGEIRTFDKTELQIWHGSLIEVISKTSVPIAKKFCHAPPYP